MTAVLAVGVGVAAAAFFVGARFLLDSYCAY